MYLLCWMTHLKNNLLQKFFQITLKIQRLVQPKISSPVIHHQTPPKNDSHLIKLISGEAPAPSKPDLKSITHVALYLTITSSEEDNEPDQVWQLHVYVARKICHSKVESVFKLVWFRIVLLSKFFYIYWRKRNSGFDKTRQENNLIYFLYYTRKKREIILRWLLCPIFIQNSKIKFISYFC